MVSFGIGAVYETPLRRAKENPILVVEKEVRTKRTGIGSQRARRNTKIFSVFSVVSWVNALPSVTSV